MSRLCPTFSDEVRKRTWKRGGQTVESRNYYGRVREAGRGWQWKRLFTEKRASQRYWEDLRRQAEHRAAGITTEDVDRLRKPVPELADAYHDLLKVAGKDEEHIRISKWMLARLIELGEWRQWSDISRDSMTKILTALEKDGTTASYRNKFIARAKAFVNAFLPDDWASPLRKVRRIREKGQKKKRARFPATMAQLASLLTLKDLPPHRLVAYALASYGGLRRNECRRLEWGDVDLEAAIPCIGVRHKQRMTDDPDVIPLHPYAATILFAWKQLSTAGEKVLPSVPDLKTLVKDLGRAKVAFKDAKGRRLDFHALRHTFATNLSRYGCSRATKKKLMRHAAQDITDGYTHAELSEMFAALEAIPAPVPEVDSCTARENGPENSGNPDASPYPTWVLGRTGSTLAKKPRWINFRRKKRVPAGGRRGKGRASRTPNRSQTVVPRGRPVVGVTLPGRYTRWGGRIIPRVPRVKTSTRIAEWADAEIKRLSERSRRERASSALPPLPLPLPAGMRGER